MWPLITQPDLYARSSRRIVYAERRLGDYLGSIRNVDTKACVRKILEDLHRRKCGLKLLNSARVRERCPRLIQRLEEQVDYNLWWGAPGASEKSHHSYPGGWILHTVTNLHSAELLCETAEQIRGIAVDRESLYVSILLHDCIKPRMFLWRAGKMDVDQGECGHHVAILTESLLRGLPLSTVMLMAGVHVGWWKNPEAVAAFVHQALELAGEEDRADELAEEIARVAWRPEAWIARQAEEAWYGGTVYAMRQIREKLGLWYRGDDDQEGNRRLWAVLMQFDELTLLERIAQGEQAFREWLAREWEQRPDGKR